MPIVKYSPFFETEDFPAGLRVFQDTVNRLLSEPPPPVHGLPRSIS